MSATLEILQAQVLALCLNADAGAEEAWEVVAAERDAELESGTVVGIPLEETMARLRARFPG